MYNKLFSRNIGLISTEEQKILKRSSIGIAGAGSDGGLLAERLTRFGIGKILIADPDFFELDNINRQFAANFKNIGKNKARVIAKELSLINPKLKLTVYETGINKYNVKEFVRKSDVIVDEVDYMNPEISILLSQETRRQNKYLFMGANIGWGVSILCFSPYGISFEKYFQFNKKNKKINLINYIKKIPKYFDKNLAKKILNEKVAIPNISSSVGLAAALLSTEIILFLLKKRKPIIVPKILVFDAFYRQIGIR